MGIKPEETPPLFERYKYAVFLLISVALIGGVIALLVQRPKPTTITVIPPAPTLIPSPTSTPSSTPTPGPYTVYITGAVASPEAVITLEYGSRVLHAIEAVGGAQENADLERVNLAQRVEDGDHIQVPTKKADAAHPTVQVRIVTATPGDLTVYVTGAVVHPQTLVTLPIGSRVEEAIAAAGGATSAADLSRLNLSQRLNDGDLVHVPALDERVEAAQTPTPNHPVLVHINYATAEELEALPGIGPSLAQDIIRYRDEHGPFTSVDELDQVPGIGPGKLDAIRDQVVID